MMMEKLRILILLVLIFYDHMSMDGAEPCDEESCRKECYEETYRLIRQNSRKRCLYLQTGVQCFTDWEAKCGKYPDCHNFKQRMLDEMYYYSCVESGNCSTSWVDKCNELPPRVSIPDVILPTNDTALQVCGIHDDFMRCKRVLRRRCPGIQAHPSYYKHNDWEILTSIICGARQDIFEHIHKCADIFNQSSERQKAFRQCMEPHNNNGTITTTKAPLRRQDPCLNYYASMECMTREISTYCDTDPVTEPSVSYFKEYQRAKLFIKTRGVYCVDKESLTGDCDINRVVAICMGSLQAKVDSRDSYVCPSIEHSELCLKNYEDECGNHTTYARMKEDLKVFRQMFMCIEDGECSTDALRECTSIAEILLDYKYLLPSQDIVSYVCSTFDEFDNCMVNLSKKCEKITFHPLFVKVIPKVEKERFTCRRFKQVAMDHIDTCASVINNSTRSWSVYSECEKPNDNTTPNWNDEEGRSFSTRKRRDILLLGEEICSYYYDTMTCLAREIRNMCPDDEAVIKAAIAWTREYNRVHIYHEHLGLLCLDRDGGENEDEVTVTEMNPVSLIAHSTPITPIEKEHQVGLETTHLVQPSTIVNKNWRSTEMTPPPQNQATEDLVDLANDAPPVWLSQSLCFLSVMLAVLAQSFSDN